MSRKIQLNAALTLALAAVAALTEKLVAADAKVVNLQNQLANIDAIEALAVGSTVVVVVGRGETRQEVEGVIRAIKAGEVTVQGEGAEAVEVVGDRTFKVEVSRTGDEFDSEFVVVKESQVKLELSEAGAEQEEAAE